MQWYCYLLRSQNPLYKNKTYNGSTNNLERRLAQHNGQKAGGAKATCGKRPWEFYAILTGFNTHNEALSCEWRIKHPTNKKQRPAKYNGIEGRINSLNLILTLDKWTSKSEGLDSEKEYILYLADDITHIINICNLKKNIIIKNINELNIK